MKLLKAEREGVAFNFLLDDEKDIIRTAYNCDGTTEIEVYCKLEKDTKCEWQPVSILPEHGTVDVFKRYGYLPFRVVRPAPKIRYRPWSAEEAIAQVIRKRGSHTAYMIVSAYTDNVKKEYCYNIVFGPSCVISLKWEDIKDGYVMMDGSSVGVQI